MSRIVKGRSFYKEPWYNRYANPKHYADAPTIIPADHIGDVNEMVTDKEGEG